VKNTIILFSVLFLTVLVYSCNNGTPTDIELDLKSTQLVEANNTFGFNLFETIIETEDANKNVMISPLSVSQALSMALNGAAENTLMEMQSALDFEGFPIDEINSSNLSLSNALYNHDPKVELNIANSIWYRNDFAPKEDFISNNKTYYKAEVESYDPLKPDLAVDNMNKWVSKNTNKKIKKIINQLNTDDVLFLINAIYFKAEWQTKFEKSDTRNEKFTCDDGTEKELETMIGEANLTYKNEEKYAAIKIPYASGKFNIIIYLPEEGYTTSDLIPELVNTDFDYLKEMNTSKMDIWLPKFEFEYENKLNPSLKEMEINDAFDPLKANFSNLHNDVYISEVLHKTYIKTDEEGSEAAAATKVSFGVTSVGPGQVVKINRSFLFAIVEEDTNAILFIGRVFDPSI
jgi:serine protease inhibitor